MCQVMFLVCHVVLPFWDRKAQMEDDDFRGYGAALSPLKQLRVGRKSYFPTGPKISISSKQSMHAFSSGLHSSLRYSFYPPLVFECIGKSRPDSIPKPEHLQRLYHYYFQFLFVESSTSETTSEQPQHLRYNLYLSLFSVSHVNMHQTVSQCTQQSIVAIMFSPWSFQLGFIGGSWYRSHPFFIHWSLFLFYL